MQVRQYVIGSEKFKSHPNEEKVLESQIFYFGLVPKRV